MDNTSLPRLKKNTERFSDRVENYVKYRPGYPQDLIDYLYTDVGFSQDSVVADIGSGTGILTALLLERGSRVIGVEPNRKMREAAETVLKGRPGFESTDGTAEATGLASRSVDYIVCAQAFHWFDRDRCKKEFQRILRPAGKAVLIWNKRKVRENGFSAGYEELLKKYANDYNEVNHKLITEDDFKRFFKEGAFSRVVFGNEQQFDFEGLKGRLLSSSYAPMPGEKNYETLMTMLKKLFDRYEVHGVISFEYETEAYAGEV